MNFQTKIIVVSLGVLVTYTIAFLVNLYANGAHPSFMVLIGVIGGQITAYVSEGRWP